MAYAPPSPAQRAGRIGGAVLAAVLSITVAVVVTRPGPPTAGIAAVGVRVTGPPADDPVARALTEQAAALLRGDRAGWLAAVDPAKPALRKRYQGIYSALRGLRISHFDYHLGIRSRTEPGADTFTVDVEVAFCFSGDPCPAYVTSSWEGPPRIAQKLTLRPARGGSVITAVATADSPTHLQPAPWESGDLVVAEGRRVSVGAPPELRGRLREAVQVADLAAAVSDRYAAAIGNPQRRYRIYLATAKTWTRWYDMGLEDWAAGYMQPLNDVGADVVVEMSTLDDRDDLREVIQHELGHVVTVSGVDPPDHWLVEGIAEHIGAQPRKIADTYSRQVLADMRPPASIVPKPLKSGASEDEAAEFYALAHYAVECMAAKYGEARMMTFVRLRLRADRSLDDAAREAFSTSFAALDRTCVRWIRSET